MGRRRQCLSFLLWPNSGPSCSSWLEVPAPEVRPVSQAFTHTFLLCWGWKRARSRKHLAGSGDRTHRHCFSEMQLLFPFLLCPWIQGSEGSLVPDILEVRDETVPFTLKNNPNSEQSP